MGERKSVGFEMDTELVEQIDDEADELNISRSEYLRQLVQAGRLIVDVGKLDTQMIRELVDDGVDSVEAQNNNIHKIDEQIVEVVLDKLPRDENRAMSKDEVRELVYGSVDEQKENIDTVCKRLYEEDKLSRAYEGGYYVK